MKSVSLALRGAAAITLAAALCGPAHAQFGSLREAGGLRLSEPDETKPGTETPGTPGTPAAQVGVQQNHFQQFTFVVAPVTTFERNFARTDNSGRIIDVKRHDAGPLFAFEKIYRLDQRDTFLRERDKHGKPREQTSFTLGLWYWYNSPDLDRFAVYGKYFWNSRIGAQLSIGGDTHLGLDQYYGFLLYNLVRADNKHKIAVQAGVGPYFPRSSQGSAGSTYTLAAAYILSDTLSVNASFWDVTFKQKFPTYGFSKTETTSRYSLGVAYSF